MQYNSTKDTIRFPYSIGIPKYWEIRHFILSPELLKTFNLQDDVSDKDLLFATSTIRFKQMYKFRGLWIGYIGVLYYKKDIII